MPNRWKPNVTVAAVIERAGRFMLVEERTPEGLRLNNPAGHLDRGESLVQACARESLEETAHVFRPTALVGVYLSPAPPLARGPGASATITYLRFAFCGELGDFMPDRQLDTGIVRTVWMTPDEVRASAHRHRSPVVLQCIDDYLAGARYPIDLLRGDPTMLAG
jgi:8-oxo-dGTP pyrophosphatase MutT (NUDIX family)